MAYVSHRHQIHQTLAGQRATGAAAYRAGERIRDERTGFVHNQLTPKGCHPHRDLLPSNSVSRQWSGRETEQSLELGGGRREAAQFPVAREFQLLLPSELSAPQRLALARSFARELSDRYGTAVDLAIHDPKRMVIRVIFTRTC